MACVSHFSPFFASFPKLSRELLCCARRDDVAFVLAVIGVVPRYVVGCTLVANGSLEPADLATFPSRISSILSEFDDFKLQYLQLYNFDDYEIRQLDQIVDILNEEPTIGISGGEVSLPLPTSMSKMAQRLSML